MSDLESRRDFLRKIPKRGVVVVSMLTVGGALTSCSPAFSNDRSQSTSPIPARAEVTVTNQEAIPKSTEQLSTTNEFLKPITKAEVRTLINNLKESPYKTFIQNLGSPFFEDVLPNTITIGGISMPLYPTVLTVTQDPGQISGRSMIRNLTVHNPTMTTAKGEPNSKVTVLVPYLYGGGELTPILVPFQDGRVFASGVGSYISLNFPKDVNLTKDLAGILPVLRVAVLIKEGMTIAVQSGMMASMKTEPVAVNDAKGGRVEVLSQTYADLLNQRGRFAAYMDLIPFVLGIVFSH